MKKVKILTDKYISSLGIYGPILTPMNIEDKEYNKLLEDGIKVELVEKKIDVPKDGNKKLFTGKNEIEKTETKDSKEINSKQWSNIENKKKNR